MWSIFSFVLHHCADEAQQYVKMFSDIERYPQLRNYYIGCHKVSMPARLAQSVEHETLNLRVVGSSPTSGDSLFFFSSFFFLLFVCLFVFSCFCFMLFCCLLSPIVIIVTGSFCICANMDAPPPPPPPLLLFSSRLRFFSCGHRCTTHQSLSLSTSLPSTMSYLPNGTPR